MHVNVKGSTSFKYPVDHTLLNFIALGYTHACNLSFSREEQAVRAKKEIAEEKALRFTK